MEVLLLEDVRGIGRRMEVKRVADGYARNFLVPRKLAMPMGSEAHALKTSAQASEKIFQTKSVELIKKLESEPIELTVKTGVHGEVFGSVKAEDIDVALRKNGFGAARAKLEKPIRVLGEHEVEIDFGHGVRGRAKIIVRPVRSERL